MKLDPACTAVLALHFERDIIEPDGPFGAVFNEMIVRHGVLENTARVLDAARDRGLPVVYARVAFPPGHPGLEAHTPLNRAVLESDSLIKGTRGTEIVEAVAPHPTDIVFDHEGTSAFIGGRLEEILSEHDIDTVILTGAATNVIVEGTARDAGNLGYHVFVLSDCVAAGDDPAHKASLATLGLIIDGVISSSDILEALTGQVA